MRLLLSCHWPLFGRRMRTTKKWKVNDLRNIRKNEHRTQSIKRNEKRLELNIELTYNIRLSQRWEVDFNEKWEKRKEQREMIVRTGRKRLDNNWHIWIRSPHTGSDQRNFPILRPRSGSARMFDRWRAVCAAVFGAWICHRQCHPCCFFFSLGWRAAADCCYWLLLYCFKSTQRDGKRLMWELWSLWVDRVRAQQMR